MKWLVQGLKLGKEGGFDGLQPEHLWFPSSLDTTDNAVIESEEVPAALKLGIVRQLQGSEKAKIPSIQIATVE